MARVPREDDAHHRPCHRHLARLVGHRLARATSAVAAVQTFDAAANITYDNETFETRGGMGGLGTRRESRPWWLPASLERRLGRDYFYNVISAAFGEGSVAP